MVVLCRSGQRLLRSYERVVNAPVGKITFWSLLAYLAFRLGDMAVRGQLSTVFSGKLGALFAAEVFLGGLVPLALLTSASLRERPTVLFIGALLTTAGVVFNRVNVVLLAMDLKAQSLRLRRRPTHRLSSNGASRSVSSPLPSSSLVLVHD